MSKDLSLQDQLDRMRRDWDDRARENARHYVSNSRTDWTDEEFYATGDQAIREQVLNDTANVCQGRDPLQMRVIEIGCGAGRLTRALSKIFGEVHGVDVSGEMVAQAKAKLEDRPNAHVYQNNGCDLRVLPGTEYDFAFSAIVFQHIPSYLVIENYVREVHRLLRTGALFKFQVQGYMDVNTAPDDTWHGVPFSEELARELAIKCGFEMRFNHGAGDQYYWLWFFKLPWRKAVAAKAKLFPKRVMRFLRRRLTTT